MHHQFQSVRLFHDAGEHLARPFERLASDIALVRASSMNSAAFVISCWTARSLR